MSNTKSRTSHIKVRQLAIDVAGVVTEARRFKTVAGMSQVTHIREAALHQYNSHLVGWFVQWQHPLELDTPDYSSEGVRRSMMDDELPPIKNEITDVIVKDEIA